MTTEETSQEKNDDATEKGATGSLPASADEASERNRENLTPTLSQREREKEDATGSASAGESDDNNRNCDRKEALDEQKLNDSPNLPHPSKTQGVPPNKQKSHRTDYENEEQKRRTLPHGRGSLSKILDDSQQFRFLELLSKGASPQAACQHFGHSFEIFQRTIDRDPTFRARRDQVEQLLSQNVAAALYRAAMEGNVTAQTQWLRNNPPDHWREDKNELPEKFQNLEKLSDDDLKRIAIYLGEQIPEELAG